jgi:hypothetical protein
MRARIWAAKACLAIASALLRETPKASKAIVIAPEEDEDDGRPLPPVGMTSAARAMLAEGEAWAAHLLELAQAAKPKPEKPLRGSVQARLEESRNRRTP